VSLRVHLSGLLLGLLPALGICTPEPEAPTSSGSGEPEQPSVQSALVGRPWRLIEIASMDGRVDAPKDRSLYTITLSADGAVRIRADCNRGTGSWTSAAPGKLQLGQIAATQAVCPPGSLHERYMEQLPWVRSYVMKDGHLFLATMADGSIIELEPAELPLTATVLGEEIRTSDASEMQEIVLTRLFDRYAEENGIGATDAEIAAFVEHMRRGMQAKGLTAEDDLTPQEAAQAEQMRREMGRAMIRQWKLNRALYQQYGGRVIFQQLGLEPLDAYRRYLEERQAAGDFKIHDKTLEERFWRYFTDDSMHDFYEPGSEQGAFSSPPWEGAADSQ
jgi:heat shock protein HslJ